MINNKKFKRYLKLSLPEGQSIFLWGARKTGKTIYSAAGFPDAISYNLLATDEYIRLLKEPALLRKEVMALNKTELSQPIIIDEVQKIPALLNEVHLLIEETPAYFILCGSSARELKRQGTNLLGGRAWRQDFYPLVYPEIPDFDLLQALNRGLIPSHYLATHWKKTVNAYINDYLKEEIKAESLVRNLAAFAQFLEVAAFSNTDLINYNNIARECGIDAKTVKEYYQILVDTLLGYYLQPYKNRKSRQDIVATPKFYFFDVCVVNGLTKNNLNQLKGREAGHLFEHYILMELIAYRGLNDKEYDIHFWRTNEGHEVDFVLGNADIAIEVKLNPTISNTDLRGLIALNEAYHPKQNFLVTTTPRKQTIKLGKKIIQVLPWQTFLEMLWSGEIIA